MKLEFINMSYDHLATGRSSMQCIRIIQKLLEQIPKEKTGTLISSSEIAQSLLEKYCLITMVIEDLSQYSEKANSDWERGIVHKDNVDAVEMHSLPFTHRSNIATRLAFIRQLLNLSGSQITQEALDRIWDILVTASKVPMD